MNKRNVILSAIYDPGSIDLHPFIGSLKKTGYTGDLVFFVSGAKPAEIASLEQQGAKVISFRYFSFRKNNVLTFAWPLWKLWFRIAPTLHAKKRLAQFVFNYMCVRFVLYHDFLEKHGAEYENVFLTDARDVYFQDDPFRDFHEKGVCFFLEDTRHTLGNNVANREMLEWTYGKEVARQLADKPISCAGTTMASVPDMMEYLKLMLEHLFNARWMHRVCINDQGVHNYLAHVTLCGRNHIYESNYGRVHTMGLYKDHEFNLDSEGRVLNADGSVVPILHQYDRFKEISARLLAQIN